MKTRKITIRARADLQQELLAAARQWDAGAKGRSIRGDYFESIDAVRRILTPGRLRLWQLIRDQKPDSIASLAAMAGRNFKSVHQDIQLLIAAGLVGLRETRGKRGTRQEPRSLADSLTLEVA
jgi:predicted transcriptional regulator